MQFIAQPTFDSLLGARTPVWRISPVIRDREFGRKSAAKQPLMCRNAGVEAIRLFEFLRGHWAVWL
jgi:hypothetical protein